MTRATRGLLALLVVCLAGCGGAGTLDDLDVLAMPASGAVVASGDSAPETEPSIRDAATIQEVLTDTADAFRTNDVATITSLLHDPSSEFGQRWQARVGHMADVPFATYELVLDDSLPDLGTQTLRERYPDPVQVVYVVERHALVDFDDAPANDDLFLTMVETSDGWRIAGDRDAEALGLISVDHLWDHGPVTTRRDGPVLALYHPDGPAIGALVEDAIAAIAEARDRWPNEWPERSPIIVPRDEEELGELLHVTFDLSNFVAFATATAAGERGAYDLTGSRIVINPARFLNRTTETRRSILVHEFVHVASRPSGGPRTPSWLDEGVAQALGERRSTTGTGLIDAVGVTNRALPTDGEFTVGGRDRIFLSYQSSWSFVDHLQRRFSPEAVGRFYAAVGRGSVGVAGTEAWHVDRAAVEVFGETIEELVQVWRTGA